MTTERARPVRRRPCVAVYRDEPLSRPPTQPKGPTRPGGEYFSAAFRWRGYFPPDSDEWG